MTYARRCLRDSLDRGEAPFASHLLYTQVLDDNLPSEREKGLLAGEAWLSAVEASVVYTDLGISDGMKRGIRAAASLGILIEFRTIGNICLDPTGTGTTELGSPE
jgi:hypothetical protein